MVDNSSKPRVQGKETRINLFTRVGNWKKETPKSPCTNLFQKATYCSPHDPSRPYISVRSAMISSIVPGSRCAPRARISCTVRRTGSMGVSLGMKNTAVTPKKITKKYCIRRGIKYPFMKFKSASSSLSISFCGWKRRWCVFGVRSTNYNNCSYSWAGEFTCPGV